MQMQASTKQRTHKEAQRTFKEERLSVCVCLRLQQKKNREERWN